MSDALKSLEYGCWKLSSDATATRTAYAKLTAGSPEECGCELCRNFAAQRNTIYSPAARALFEALGIRSCREAEIYHMGRVEFGRHLYGGWFHFVGFVVFRADAAKQVSENVWRPDLESESENFGLGFTSRVHLVREPFKGSPLVQLEFNAHIPSILEAKEPQQSGAK
jgi:hypothetical protein